MDDHLAEVALVFSVLNSEGDGVWEEFLNGIGTRLSPADDAAIQAVTAVRPAHEFAGGYLAVMRESSREDREDASRRGFVCINGPDLCKYALGQVQAYRIDEHGAVIAFCRGEYMGRPTSHFFGQGKTLGAGLAAAVRRHRAANPGADCGAVADLVRLLRRFGEDV